MPDFDQFFRELKDGVSDIAVREASGLVKDVTDDGKDFLEAIKGDLALWTKQVSNGQLSASDFEFLVRGKKDLAQMKALTQAGLAAVRTDRIRTAMIDLVISAAGRLV
jgi:hypothetical protein